MVGGSYNKALEAVEKLMNKENLSLYDRLECLLLKRKLLVKKGQLDAVTGTIYH